MQSSNRIRSVKERGSAGIEFMLSLPFMVTLLVGVIDLSFAFKEYYFLLDAVSEGGKRAMTAPEFGSAVSFASGTREGCVGQIADRDVIGDRVTTLVHLHNRALSDLCIVAERTAAASNPGEDDTVLVQAVGTYSGLFPAFRALTISAQVRVPYLLKQGAP